MVCLYSFGLDTVLIKGIGPHHTVNCCMAYRKRYIHNKYDETVRVGEEKFLRTR